jgi:FMN phosphatase YigB (HAD superfamily)
MACDALNYNVIKAVAFDIGNVLLDWTPKPLLRQILLEHDLRLSEDGFDRLYREVLWPVNAACDAGATFVEEYTRHYANSHPELAGVFATIPERYIEMFAPIANGLAALDIAENAGLHVSIWSNMPGEVYPQIAAKYPRIDRIGVKVLSYAIRKVKPQREFYQYALDKMPVGISPNEVLFFDDRKDNIYGAREFGIQAVQVKPDVDLREELRSWIKGR